VRRESEHTIPNSALVGPDGNLSARRRIWEECRECRIDDGSNQIEASAASATTLADNTPSSDTVTSVELDTAMDEEYTYDANGNLTQKTEDVNGTTVQWDYTYSVEGWLVKVEKTVGVATTLTEEYTYDPIGRKYQVVTTTGSATTRYFVYDGGSPILELDSSLELEKEFVRGLSLGGGIGGLLYTRDENADVGYFHYDGQGNVVAVRDEAREAVAYYEYDAWGNVLTACGDYANEFAFSTKQASTGTGLIDFGRRWYDSKTGRWTQRDPLLRDSLNLYGYCLDLPTGLIDPDGLKARTAGGAALEFGAYTGGGALGGAAVGAVILPGVGAVPGAAIGAGLGAVAWLGQQLWGSDEYIEDMETNDAVKTVFMDICYGAAVGYYGTGLVKTAADAYWYYSAPSSSAADSLATRAREVHSVLDPIAQTQRTTAVLQTNTCRIVAGGGRDLTPAQRALLGANEVAAQCPGAHAEVTALGCAQERGLTPQMMVGSRAMCKDCVEAIKAAGGQVIDAFTAVWP